MSLKHQRQRPFEYHPIDIDLTEPKDVTTIDLNSCRPRFYFAVSIFLSIIAWSWIPMIIYCRRWILSGTLWFIIIVTPPILFLIILRIIHVRASTQSRYNVHNMDPFKHVYDYVNSVNSIRVRSTAHVANQGYSKVIESDFYCCVLDQFSYIDKSQFFKMRNEIGMIQFNLYFKGIKFDENVRKTLDAFTKESEFAAAAAATTVPPVLSSSLTYSLFGIYREIVDSKEEYGKLIVYNPMNSNQGWLVRRSCCCLILFHAVFWGLMALPINMAKLFQCGSKTIHKALIYDVHFSKKVLLRRDIVPIAFLHRYERMINQPFPKDITQIIHRYIGEFQYPQSGKRKESHCWDGA